MWKTEELKKRLLGYIRIPRERTVKKNLEDVSRVIERLSFQRVSNPHPTRTKHAALCLSDLMESNRPCNHTEDLQHLCPAPG